MGGKFGKVVVSAALAALLVVGAACAPVTPEISEAERQDVARNATPYVNDVGYTQALARLRKMIEAIPDSKTDQIYIQAKPIGNSSISSETGGENLPLDITNMVITALNSLSSRKRLLVIPYDPLYYARSKETNVGVGASQRSPELILAGSITEFDKEVEVSGSELNADLLLDQGRAGTTLSGDATNSRKMSRVTVDLYLINARLNAVIPGLSVSNTVNVMEFDKTREAAFAIFGSGMGVKGNATYALGFQRAVRALVGYSVVQLLGRFYQLPYESLLGLTVQDPLIKRAASEPPPPAVVSPQVEPAVTAPAPQPTPQPPPPATPNQAAAEQTVTARPASPQPEAPPVVSSAAASPPSPAFTNSMGMRFAYIPPGVFMMGTESVSRDFSNEERPAHEVTISGFYLGMYQVTQAQWQAVMGRLPEAIKAEDRGADKPVIQVSYNDVQAFISRLNLREQNGTYRLPTEAEWEYAARAGQAGDFPYGHDAALSRYAWSALDKKTGPQSVGGKEPNPFGLYDMLGNVWEWVRDWYDANYYSDSPRLNPTGPVAGQYRVMRGGAYAYDQTYCRVSYRYSTTEDTGWADLGFRLAFVPK